MELNFKSAEIPCWTEVFSQTLRREAAQEAIVPDTLPDIGTILSSSGQVLIRGKDVGEGRVRIETNLPIKIACEGSSGEGVFLQEMDIPLTLSVEDPAISEAAPCVAELALTTLEVKAPNPRKLSVRAEVTARLRCFSPDRLLLPGVPEQAAEGVHLREQEWALTKIAAVTEKTFILTDEFTLPQDRPAVSLLDSQLLLDTPDCRTVGNKLVIKGAARSRLVYLTEDGTAAPLEVSTEFNQILEADSLPENPLVQLALIPSGVYYEFNGEGKAGNLELHLVAQAVICGAETVRGVVDAYSNANPLEADTEELPLRRVLRSVTQQETLAERINLPQPAEAVTAVTVQPGVPIGEGDGIRLPLTVSACYQTAAGELRTLRHGTSVRFPGETEANRRVEPTGVCVQELTLLPSGSGLELRAAVELRGLLWEEASVTCISALRFDPEERLDSAVWPSLVLLRPEESMELWTLARENHSTVEAIRESNHLEGEEVSGGEKLLLIPKCL